MQIFPLSEGTFTIDKTKLFVPFDTSTDELQERPVGSLLVEIQPFVIITNEDILLLDTGLGFKNASGEFQVHQNLKDNGIDPASITKVLLSHLHKDHAGGVGASFPKAKFYIQKKEFEFAFQKGFPSYIPEELEVLRHSNQVIWLDGNGVIDGYIKYEVTGAHSPFTKCFGSLMEVRGFSLEVMMLHNYSKCAAGLSPSMTMMEKSVWSYDNNGGSKARKRTGRFYSIMM